MSALASITDPDQLAIATIRTLCIDAVQQANLLKELQTKFGFTPDAVVGIAKARLAASAAG